MKSLRQVTGGQIHDSTYERYPEKSNSGTENRVWLPGAGGNENGELVFNGYRVSLKENEKVLKMDGADICTTM